MERDKEEIPEHEWADPGLRGFLEDGGAVRPHDLHYVKVTSKNHLSERVSRSGLARRARRGLVDSVLPTKDVAFEASRAIAKGSTGTVVSRSLRSVQHDAPELFERALDLTPASLRNPSRAGLQTYELRSGSNGVTTALRLLGDSSHPVRDEWVVVKAEKDKSGRAKRELLPITSSEPDIVDRELIIAPILSRVVGAGGLMTVAEILRVVWVNEKVPEKGGWPVMEVVRPLRLPNLGFKAYDLRTLLAFPRLFGFRRALSVVFQVIWTLAYLQVALPGFRHNDFHGANVMLTNWDGKAHSYALHNTTSGKTHRFVIPSADIIVKLIDFGYTTWKGSPKNLSHTRGTGISSHTNDYYDTAQFLFLLHLGMQQRNAPKWADMFLRFIWDVFPRRFLVSKARNSFDYLTPASAREVKKSEAWTPLQMLYHPIFTPFRSKGSAPAEAVIKTAINPPPIM